MPPEAHAGGAAGLLRCHAASEVHVRFHLEMEPQLFLELVIEPISIDPPEQPRRQDSQPGHRAPPLGLRTEHARENLGHLLPVLGLDTQLSTPDSCQRVESGPPVVVRSAPRGADPPALL